MTELTEKLYKQKAKELLEIHRGVFIKYLKFHDSYTKLLVNQYDFLYNKDTDPDTMNYEYSKEMRMFIRDLKEINK